MKKLKLLTEKRPVVHGLWELDAFIEVDTSFRDKKGRILLSPPCVGATEVKSWADSLINELEEIKRKAERLKWDNHPSREK